MPSSPSDPNQTVDESAAPFGGEDPGSGREQAAAVHELRREPKSLEEVFMDLTGRGGVL